MKIYQKPRFREHMRQQTAINNVAPAKPMWAVECGTKYLYDLYCKAEYNWPKAQYIRRQMAIAEYLDRHARTHATQ